jgi:secondary thiamine-phosphate synthase enzyme
MTAPRRGWECALAGRAAREVPHFPGAASFRRYAGAMLRQSSTRLTIETPGRGLHDITRDVSGWVATSGISEGLLTLFVRHTSASLLIQENADPDVRGDLDRFFERLVPDGDRLFRHRDEGVDDMPAHVRTALTATHLSVPVNRGRMVLGTWQGIYIWEHRLRPHRREVAVHLLGE